LSRFPAPSMLWYDYETFGADPRRDLAVQFAAIRTDMELNPIEEPIDLFCQPSPDTVPDPIACLITGISPFTAQQKGLLEADFADQINKAMSQPNTCTLGYNSIRFDDEVTRFLLYRNLMDPYEREWKNGNSRWDFLDVTRLTWALRPDEIEWPVNDEGKVSFRLEHLTEANGIGHEKAHDAVSDVKATIAFARLIKQTQPKLYDFAFGLRRKQAVAEQLDVFARKPVLHISGMFPVEQGCMAVVVPLTYHPSNRNEVICFNLGDDPQRLMDLSVEQLAERLFVSNDDLPEGESRIGLKSIHLNRSPMVAPVKMLTTQVAERFGHDLTLLRNRAEQLRELPGLDDKIHQLFSKESADIEDVDSALYQGFIADQDKSKLAQLRQMTPEELANHSFRFQDSRLPELVFRYRARNWSQTLSSEEQQRWHQHCARALQQPDYGCPRSLAEVQQQLPELRQTFPEQSQLLNDLENYYQQLAQLIV
jgi:exodeoxyribonuclease-1